MKLGVTRIQLKEMIHLEPLGGLYPTIPQAGKPVPEMYYDTEMPEFIVISCQGHKHFVPLGNLKAASFESTVFDKPVKVK